MNALTKLSNARQQLAECRTLDEAKNIRDQAEAVRAYCKQQSDGLDAQNYAAEIKLRAERRCGQLLAEMNNHGGDRKSRSRDVTLKLDDIGISKMQSHRWQTEATVPEDEFDSFVRSTHEGSQELTSSRLYKLGKKLAVKDPEPCESLSGDGSVVGFLTDLEDSRYGCVYADPPWKYGNQGTRAATSGHYPTLSVDELCEWPVGDKVAADAHIHLWTTNAFLRDAFRVIDAWGFEYRSCYVWVKPQMGIGNYWRVSHEFLLLGIRGRAKRFNNRGLMSWGQFDRGKHSSKPEEIRSLIEAASPGPYLELFGRKAVQGWTVLGNQVEETLIG